jgi:predicted enzyme related to lactoylglutathione lyase
MQTKPSAFCHIVIPSPDLQKARVFYEQIFGWKVQAKIPGDKYWFFESGNVNGAFDGNRRPAAQSVVLVMRVTDLRGTLERIVQHGGKVTRNASRIGEASPGYDAYFLDPNGNEMGLYSEAN